MESIEIVTYVTADGKSPFREWMGSFKDRQARDRIDARLARVELGNLGDTKDLGGGIQEIRIFAGPGYRIYFAREGKRMILLLCAGDKKSQRKDVARAREMYADYQAEKE